MQSLRAYVRETSPDELREQLGADAGDLAQIVPELREMFADLPERVTGDGEGARVRLFDAIAQFLRHAAQHRPVVLVLGDLHAADPSSLLLLRFVVRELADARILIVGACRDVDPLPAQPLKDMLAEVSREPVTCRVALAGLHAREVAQYVQLTASPIASDELMAAVHEETQGNPFFVSEIVRLLAIEGVSYDAVAQRGLVIPQSVRDVVTRRSAICRSRAIVCWCWRRSSAGSFRSTRWSG